MTEQASTFSTKNVPRNFNYETQFPKLPSTTIEWPIIAINSHTYRKFYAKQQPTQIGITRSKLPWFMPHFSIFFFVGLIWLIGFQLF